MLHISQFIKYSLISLIISIPVHARTESFNIGAPNWIGTLPGAATYDQTIGGIHVTGTGERVISVPSDVTAVFSGGDSVVEDRNYSYTFPLGATVSIDFTNLTRFIAPGKSFTTINGIPEESVGNFSTAPSSFVLGNGHRLVNGNTELLGDNPAVDETVSTLTWTNINSLSFDIASNGIPSFVAHRNMVVTVANGPITSVPSLSSWSLICLGMLIFLFAIRRFKTF